MELVLQIAAGIVLAVIILSAPEILIAAGILLLAVLGILWFIGSPAWSWLTGTLSGVTVLVSFLLATLAGLGAYAHKDRYPKGVAPVLVVAFAMMPSILTLVMEPASRAGTSLLFGGALIVLVALLGFMFYITNKKPRIERGSEDN